MKTPTHTFPSNKVIICKDKITLENFKEIVFLCKKNDIYISDLAIVNPLSDNYVYFGWDGEQISRYSYNNDLPKIPWNEFKSYFDAENEYKITKEQILHIEKTSPYSVSREIKQWFPDCFKKELIVGRWYKMQDKCIDWLMNYQGIGSVCYGFNSDKEWGTEYLMCSQINDTPLWREATPEEVEESLIAYAKSKYKKGDRIKYGGFEGTISGEIYWANGSGLVSVPCDKKSTRRPNENFPLMKGGIWSEILPTKKKMTISEIEEKLGHGVEIKIEF